MTRNTSQPFSSEHKPATTTYLQTQNPDDDHRHMISRMRIISAEEEIKNRIRNIILSCWCSIEKRNHSPRVEVMLHCVTLSDID